MASIKKIFLIETIMFAILFLIGIFFNTILQFNYFFIIFWLLAVITLYFNIGFEKEKSVNKIDIMQIIFIYSFIYLIATYLFGFFFGFVKSPYSMNIIKIIVNIAPVLGIIVIQELIRYMVVIKSDKRIKPIIFIIIIFVLAELLTGISSYNLTSPTDIFEMIGLLLLPSIAKNILLSLIIKEGTYKATILYRLIFDLSIFIVPIIPDLGTYLTSVFNILIPVYLYSKINKVSDNKAKLIIREKPKLVTNIITVFIILVLGVMIILVSGVFKYYAMSIGSGSMTPNINMGDTVIIKKINLDQLDTLKKGDVLAFKNENKIIVHRIISIRENNKGYRYVTKGDNNNDIDDFITESKDVRGKVVFNIRFAGWPSVILGQLINK